ncbi:MAG TPA: hypothetical protein PK736_08250, partial [Bacteroidia bacterium]|nr:hypothetical protein [Bacteroidia bacterium]
AHSFTDFPFALARYNTNGSLDSTFDTDGKVTTNFGLACQANSMAIQADNKILVAGSSNNGNKNDFALVRYNTNGSLDTSFDDDGIVTTQIGLYDDVGSSVALQTDGKILVSGYTYDSVYCNFALVRYNINGSLDTSFGTDGIVLTTISSYNDFCNSLTIQGDGKIILAGSSDNGNAYDIALARYNTNGSLDTTFEGDGIVTTSIDTTSAFGSAIGIQSDGKIVVSGGHHNGTYSDFALVRYNNNGSIDSTFDSDGIVVTDFGNFAQIKSLVLQTDDKIVVAGYSYVSPNFYFAIARYNINGSLDTSFDSDGIVTTDFGTINNVARAVAIQSDGKILAGGNTNPLIFAIARYNVCIPVLS